MSHYTTVQLQISDADLLITVLQQAGYTPRVHLDRTVNLRGYRADTRKEVAHIVVPKEQISRLSNDIGFFLNASGNFEAIISEYDRSLPKVRKDFLQNIPQQYARQTVLREAFQMGYSITETTNLDGTLTLELVKNTL